MKNLVLAAGLATISLSGLAQAQTFPDLGHALAAMGYTGTVWVNSFDPAQAHLAHGVFSSNTPIDPVTGNYEARYGMALTGSGTVSVDPTTGFYMATGTAHNPNPIASDGSLAIDLLSNGNLADGGSVPFNCPASSNCAWTVHFQTKPPLSNPSVRLYRHVEGSACGGELSIDLNSCRSALIPFFHLPAAYQFTSTDNIDTNYVALRNATTTVLCAVIKPLCSVVITVSGPISGQVNLPNVYSANATNCTPNPTGWAWTVTGGGVIAGAATGSQVTVSWPANGSYSVLATNSGCSGAQGSQSVNIGDGGGCGGGNPQAKFTVSPPAPKVGVPVSFDSSPSTCVAGSSFDWTFGDGTPGASGPTATHIYNTAGTYNAQLTITPVGCLNTACLSTATVSVKVDPGVILPNAQFMVSPNATQQATFDASPSTNVPAGSLFGWNFGDGSPAGSGPVVLHTYAAPNSYSVALTITPPGCNTAGCQGVTAKTLAVGPSPSPSPPPADFTSDGSCTNDTCQAQATTAVTLTAAATDATAYAWSFGDGTAGGGRQVTHAWAQPGTFAVSLTAVKGSAAATKTRSFVVGPATPPPSADFSSDGSCINDTCQAQATTAVTLTAVATDAAAYNWTFGDGTTGSGRQVTHAWAQTGTFAVSLTAVKGPLTATKTRSFVVCPPPPPPPPSADFSPDGPCTNDPCQVKTATAVTLTAVATDATVYAWSFGDGATGSGRQVTHAWAQPGTYAVSLTAVKDSAAATKTHSFGVSLIPPTTKTTLLPLVTESRVAPVQASDLYVYNPGTTPLAVTLEFRKRGTPEVNPPQATRTVAPGATLYAPDVLSGTFNVANVAGFITAVTGINTVEPVITSFNSQGATASKLFALTLPGTPVSGGAGSSQFLVGLHDTADRQSSFGVSNPAGDPATYHLRFYDKTGKLVAEPPDLTLAGHEQRLFALQDIRNTFGVKNLDDYRVEVKPVSGPQLFPFGSDIRIGSGDPSFTEPGSTTTPKLYLLGVFTGAQAANTTWQTDLLLANTGDQAAQTTLTFTGTGGNVKTAGVAVPAGSTTRLANALASQFGLSNATGVLTVTSTSPNGIFPIPSAESYDNTNPAKRYGESLVAMSDADAADPGKKEVLVGLRQDGSHKTTLWVFNPSDAAGVYDLVYRGLDGTVLGTLPGIKIAANRLTQISPVQHPINKTTGVPKGFTVEVVVKSGKALAAAQVVNTGSNDPSYIAGEVR